MMVHTLPPVLTLKLLIDKSLFHKIGLLAALGRTWVAPAVDYWNAGNLVWRIHFRPNNYQKHLLYFGLFSLYFVFSSSSA
jgi:hypothetical protein